MRAEIVGAAIGLAVHNAFEPRLYLAGHPNVIEVSGVAEGDAPSAKSAPR